MSGRKKNVAFVDPPPPKSSILKSTSPTMTTRSRSASMDRLSILAEIASTLDTTETENMTPRRRRTRRRASQTPSTTPLRRSPRFQSVSESESSPPDIPIPAAAEDEVPEMENANYLLIFIIIACIVAIVPIYLTYLL